MTQIEWQIFTILVPWCGLLGLAILWHMAIAGISCAAWEKYVYDVCVHAFRISLACLTTLFIRHSHYNLWTFIRYQESCLLFNSLVPRSPVNTNVNESYSIVNSSTRLFESLIIQIDETRLQDRQVWISEWLFNSMVLHLN